MALLVLLLLVALLVAELAVLIEVSQAVGVLDAIALLLVTSLVGVWLTRRSGRDALRRVRRVQAAGSQPSREVTDGALGLAAGVLLIVPGFITDTLGIALLLPPVRAGARSLILHRLRRHGRIVVHHEQSFPNSGSDMVWDVESWEERPRSQGRREIGGPS
jgi:UPF0716 protein FxsA